MKRKNAFRSLSLIGAVALSVLFMSPPVSQAADAPATLHVVETVINDDGGTAVPADFIIHVRYLMHEVAGSPAPGVAAPGQTYTLPAGSYLITEDALPYTSGYPTYNNYFSINGVVVTGFVTLSPGDDVTITSTSNDWPAGHPVAVAPAPVVPVTPTPTTVTGGTLPTTSSPWFNLLAIGFGMVLVGTIGLKNRKIFN